MSHSVRLRFVDWLQRIVDQPRKGVAKVLRSNQAHSQPDPDIDMGLVGHVENSLAQRQVYNVVQGSSLGDKISEMYAGLSVSNFPLPACNAGSLAALNDHFAGLDAIGFVCHLENPPQPGNIDLSTVNAKLAGVQS